MSTWPTIAAIAFVGWHITRELKLRTALRQNARIRAHAWGHWEALMLGHAANDASPPRATAGGNGRFTMDLDTANGMTRYRLLDGGVVVRSGWVSDAGMLSAEFERFCGERGR